MGLKIGPISSDLVWSNILGLGPSIRPIVQFLLIIFNNINLRILYLAKRAVNTEGIQILQQPLEGLGELFNRQ